MQAGFFDFVVEPALVAAVFVLVAAQEYDVHFFTQAVGQKADGLQQYVVAFAGFDASDEQQQELAGGQSEFFSAGNAVGGRKCLYKAAGYTVVHYCYLLVAITELPLCVIACFIAYGYEVRSIFIVETWVQFVDMEC